MGARVASEPCGGSFKAFPWGGVGAPDWHPGWVGLPPSPLLLGPPLTPCPVLEEGRGTLLCLREMSLGFLDFGRNTGLSCNFKSWFLLRLKMALCWSLDRGLVPLGPGHSPASDGASEAPAGATSSCGPHHSLNRLWLAFALQLLVPGWSSA